MAAKTPDNAKLLVISFDDPLRAQEFLLAVARLQKNQEIQLHDAVLVSKIEGLGCLDPELGDATVVVKAVA